jgi:hypothetical protein
MSTAVAFRGTWIAQERLGFLLASPDGRVASEGYVRPVSVEVGDVAAHEVKQVPGPENDDVIEQFASQRPDKPLRETVLPR